MAASVRNPNAIVVVARTAQRIAGFGIMRYGDDDAHLDLLAVHPEHRREGLGRRLVEWLEKVALVAGISAVFLEVRESNYGAQAFYERLGYRSLARLARYYQGRESAMRMGRELGYGANLSPTWIGASDPGGKVLSHGGTETRRESAMCRLCVSSPSGGLGLGRRLQRTKVSVSPCLRVTCEGRAGD